MSAAEVLSLIKEKDVRFVDFRFTDTKGKEQHVTMPASQAGASLFKDGKMFDGSSISGWKGINESDMVLMPDLNSLYIDPFFGQSTLAVGAAAAVITITIGITVGALAGYYRGWVDEALMRITEFFQVLPPLHTTRLITTHLTTSN